MFEILIKVSALEKRRRSIGLLHVVAGFFLLANVASTYKVLESSMLWVLAIFFLVAAGSVVYGLLRGRLDNGGQYNAAVRGIQFLAFFILAIIWVQTGSGIKSLGLFIWAGLSGMLAFTEGVALQTPALRFDESGVSFPNGFSRKLIGWNALESVALRPDFLTLYLPENRFLQFELKEATDAATSANLQDFCRRKLGKEPVVS